MNIKKVLIVNRGEIAIRIIRTLKEMNIKSAVVFSEADRLSLHVKYADEAYFIGDSAPNNSYLNINKIIDVLHKSNADAVHPGYGFLSENAGFAKKIIALNKIFIGPDPEIIDLLGDKTKAREIMIKNNIPIVKGSPALIDIKKLKVFADDIGYPVIIKAIAGGGGRGMRRVFNEKDFEVNAQNAINEAKICFGIGEVFVEKYVDSAKHIEFQVLGDAFGNVVHLGERDCSIQRRHQKLLEEAPSIAVSTELRKKIGETAIKIAKTVGYKNAGTIEFLLDKNNNYYFMEMNTRLQVEHPVTEMITNIDIVREQINIANGLQLNYTQDDININGAAIECRINAEDFQNNFMPCAGKIKNIIFPGGFQTRVDTCAYPGYEIPKFYDSMIAKIIVHEKTRKLAIEKMKRALNEFIISGIKSTIGFHYRLLQNKKFINGEYDTKFLENHYLDEGRTSIRKEKVAAAVAAISKYNSLYNTKIYSNEIEPNIDKWKLAQKIERIK
jgi:acetyl-CoA carboxylase biotin carboxylase subunit